MELYASLDLHSRNTYIGVMDDSLTAFKISCQYLNQQKLQRIYRYRLAIPIKLSIQDGQGLSIAAGWHKKL